MKKAILVSAVFAALSFSAVAAPIHENYVGSVDNFTGTIKNQDQFNNLIKYTTWDVQKTLRAAFADGELTAEEIKASGIKDHHFYQGYLGSATSQGEFDKYMSQLNGGKNTDDYLVSNRDLKASNSMVLNQVKAGNAIQNTANQLANEKQDIANKAAQDAIVGRLDSVVSGLQQMGTVTPPPVTGGEYDDTAVKGDIASNKADINTNKENITTNSNSIAAMGNAFEQRVDTVNGYLGQIGDAIKSNSNTALNGRVDNLENAFAAQAAHTTQEIARLDGRIDDLEKKTDKMKAGIAGANAIGSLTQYTGSGTHHVAVGIGGYEGANAIAGGYTYAVSKNTTIRATVAYDSEGDFGFGASVGHSW